METNTAVFREDGRFVYNGVKMKTLAEIKHLLLAEKPYLAERYGVTEIGVFGSYVRHEQRQDSDVDVLIELEDPPRIRPQIQQILTDYEG